jgi:hypothetical protein
MNRPTKYWFPAKRYGWGWGAPLVWQGWIVVLLYGVFMAVGGFLVNPRQNVLLFLAYVAVVTCGLVAVCWLKGEPPRWRGGKSGA